MKQNDIEEINKSLNDHKSLLKTKLVTIQNFDIINQNHLNLAVVDFSVKNISFLPIEIEQYQFAIFDTVSEKYEDFEPLSTYELKNNFSLCNEKISDTIRPNISKNYQNVCFHIPDRDVNPEYFFVIVDEYYSTETCFFDSSVQASPDCGIITIDSIDNFTGLDSEKSGGGCLIATATYGSELAPQVQQLRELRDNSLLQTESGTSFMNTFNDVYYSFSPVIADYERENPVFKEVVKITLTPLISSLSILNYVNVDSEAKVLGYGISLILLNLGMYFVAPVIVIHRIRKFAC